MNLEDDEHPADDAYSPDGGYVPRVLFADRSGSIRKDIYNRKGIDKYKYFYSSSEELKTGMQSALTQMQGTNGEL